MSADRPKVVAWFCEVLAARDREEAWALVEYEVRDQWSTPGERIAGYEAALDSLRREVRELRLARAGLELDGQPAADQRFLRALGVAAQDAP